MKKLIISTSTLAPALKKVGLAINKGSVLPILSNLLVKASTDQAVFISTDLEITIHYKVACECKTEFQFLVPFEILNKIVTLNKSCPLTIESGKSLKIFCENDVYEVKSPEAVSKFPKLQEMPEDKGFDINSDILHCLNTALATTGSIQSKPAAAFVLMEIEKGKITVASSDKTSMVYSMQFDADVDDSQEILLSHKIIKVLEGSSEARVHYTEKIAGFVAGDITIINTRTETKYGDFRKVFEDDWPVNLSINRHDLLNALGKCSISSDETRATHIDLTDKGQMKLLAEDGIIKINPSLPCQYSGEVEDTCVNSDKLIKMLHQVDYPDVEFAIHNRNSKIILSSKEHPGYKAMIMPIAQIAKSN